MRKNETGFGVSGVIIIMLTIIIVGMAGYVVYDKQDKKSDNNYTSHPAPVEQKKETTTPSAKVLTDEEQVRKAAGCNEATETVDNCRVQIVTNRGERGDKDLANVFLSNEANVGAMILLAKEANGWTVVYRGNGDVPQDVLDKYDFPKDWLGPSL